jgi:hypothetical protein
MAYNVAELRATLARLRDNVNFQQYVNTLETHFNDRVTTLLASPHPDEALRGECRALHNMLKNINKNTGELT